MKGRESSIIVKGDDYVPFSEAGVPPIPGKAVSKSKVNKPQVSLVRKAPAATSSTRLRKAVLAVRSPRKPRGPSASIIQKEMERQVNMKRAKLSSKALSPYSESSENDERYNPEHRGMAQHTQIDERRTDSYDTDDYRTDRTGTDEERIDSYESYTDLEGSASYTDLEGTTSQDTHYEDDDDDRRPHSPVDKYKKRLKKWYQNRLPILSPSETNSTLNTAMSNMTNATDAETAKRKRVFSFVSSTEDEGDDDYFKTRQDAAYCTIVLTVVQLLILMLQLAMCGIAPFDVNPMIGPFPDAFSLWGGKNPYKMLEENEWWRMVTPALLHVGILHLAANVFCQLSAVALFEREWGWFSWSFIFIVSTVGCSAFSNWFDQDTVAVGSSGSLMGLFAAKLAQVVTLSFFNTKEGIDVDDVIQFDQLSSVLCGLTLVSLLGCFTYIDWSGNMGGLLAGFLAGMCVFSSSIDGCCWRFWWFLLGFTSMIGSIGYIIYLYVETGEPEEELTDVCNYFRNLMTEGYECGCLW